MDVAENELRLFGMESTEVWSVIDASVYHPKYLCEVLIVPHTGTMHLRA